MKRAHCLTVTAVQMPLPTGKTGTSENFQNTAPGTAGSFRPVLQGVWPTQRLREDGCGTYLRLIKFLFSVCDFISNDGPNIFNDHGVLLDVSSSIQAQSLGGKCVCAHMYTSQKHGVSLDNKPVLLHRKGISKAMLKTSPELR